MGHAIGIVWNPSKVDEHEIVAAFEAACEAQGIAPEAHWYETSPDDPGFGAAGRALADGCELVIAAGGDGTVRAVAERLGTASEAGSDSGSGSDPESETEPGAGPRSGPESGSRSGSPSTAELGIVPLGTGNLLARNLGVPLGSAKRAFERALTREASSLDLGEVRATLADGEELRQGFVVMVGFGIDAQMIVETDDDLKAKTGWLAYVESLGRAASGTEVVELDLSIDGEEATSESAHTLLVGNCGSIQGGLTLLPDASPDDGQLDLLLLRADTVVAWVDTMRNMAWDNGLRRFFVKDDEERATSTASTGHRRGQRISVELSSPLAFEIDGDDVGEVTAFEARVFPGALRVR